MSGSFIQTYMENANMMTTSSVTIYGGVAAVAVPLGTHLPKAPLVLGDLVWNDTIRNGVQDSSEVGVGNVLLTLNGTETVSGASVSRKLLTDSEGGYQFGALLPGVYTVTMAAVPGMELTGLDRKSASNTDVDDEVDSDFRQGIRQATVTLAAGASNNNLDAGLLSFNGFIWNNQLLSEDVDDNGVVTPLDALLIIIELNSKGPRPLDPPTSTSTPAPFIDVDHNGSLTPLDALLVIIRLNSGGGGEGESPATTNFAAARTADGDAPYHFAPTQYYPPDWFTTMADDDTKDEFFATLGDA
jgi:hypothetical protein